MSAVDSVELRWGIRQSFVAYVDRLADGVVRVTGGAVREGDGFRLPGRRLSSDAWAFDGGLHFSGYAGVLDVTLTDIRIDGDELSAEVGGTRLPVALLADRSDPIARAGESSVRFDAVVLTDDGAAVLGGVYAANAPADPVTIRTVGHPADETLTTRTRIS